MDIGGINRIKTLMPAMSTDVRKNDATATDRDAQGGGYQKNPKPQKITPEQEELAVKLLNEMASFSKAGLRAELVRGVDVATHVVVRDGLGNIIRRMSYEQLIDLYLERNLEKSSGRLLKRAA